MTDKEKAIVMAENHEVTSEQIKRAIEKLQQDHPIPLYLDITRFNEYNEHIDESIHNIINDVERKVADDANIGIICEMARLYMMGITPVYENRSKGEWIKKNDYTFDCNLCGCSCLDKNNYCPDCGAKMELDEEAENEDH